MSELQFIKKILETKGIFVSVGSGMGRIEQELISKGKIVFCIDPNNTDMVDRYTGEKRVKKPDYSYVSEFIKDKPSSIGKVNLILLHPLPDYSLYDIFSILSLEPKKIFLYYMKTGGSGSWLLHRFLRKNDVNTIAKIKMDISFLANYQISFDVCPIKYKYKQVFEKDIDKGYGHTYSILERKEELEKQYNISDKLLLELLLDKEEEVLGKNNIEKDVKKNFDILFDLSINLK